MSGHAQTQGPINFAPRSIFEWRREGKYNRIVRTLPEKPIWEVKKIVMSNGRKRTTKVPKI